MACDTLKKGLDLRCRTIYRKYVQKAVIINMSDIKQKIYYDYAKAIFVLKENKTGYAFIATDQSLQIDGKFSKSRQMNLNRYQHTVSIPIVGVTDEVKNILKELDDGIFIAALKFSDGTIEIYGMEYGLITAPYTYSVQNAEGGSSIELVSKTEERTPPMIWNTEIRPASDFDDLFVDSGDPIVVPGDYSYDYSNDYLIQL